MRFKHFLIIPEIQKEENWIFDKDFSLAVKENIDLLIKLTNWQKICLLTVSSLDPKSTFLQENPIENSEKRLQEFQAKKTEFQELLNLNFPKEKEGVLL